jgi:hypothetical protein
MDVSGCNPLYKRIFMRMLLVLYRWKVSKYSLIFVYLIIIYSKKKYICDRWKLINNQNVLQSIDPDPIRLPIDSSTVAVG